MSYCVNCGVELDKTIKECPLCSCAVLNPMQDIAEQSEPLYPNDMDILDHTYEKRLFASILIFLYSSGAFIALAVDLHYAGRITWSILVMGGVALFALITIPPIVIKNLHVVSRILTYGISIFSYTVLIGEYAGQFKWVMYLSLPICAFATLMSFTLAVLIEFVGIPKWYIPAIFFFGVGTLNLVIEASYDIFRLGFTNINWAWFVMVPCYLLSILFVVIERNKRLKLTLEKRLHF